MGVPLPGNNNKIGPTGDPQKNVVATMNSLR